MNFKKFFATFGCAIALASSAIASSQFDALDYVVQTNPDGGRVYVSFKDWSESLGSGDIAQKIADQFGKSLYNGVSEEIIPVAQKVILLQGSIYSFSSDQIKTLFNNLSNTFYLPRVVVSGYTNETMQEMRSMSENFQKQIADQTSKLKTVTEQFERVKEATQNSLEISEYEGYLKDRKEELEKVRRDLEILRLQKNRLESEIKKLEDDKAEIQNRIIDEANDKCDSAKIEFKTIQEKLEQAKYELEIVQKATQNSIEISQYEGYLKDRKEELEKVRRDLEILGLQKNQLGSEIAQLQEEITRLQEEIARRQEEIARRDEQNALINMAPVELQDTALINMAPVERQAAAGMNMEQEQELQDTDVMNMEQRERQAAAVVDYR